MYVTPTPPCAVQIEVDSELQSLRARLDDMTEKYSRAVAEREKVDSAPLQEVRVRFLLDYMLDVPVGNQSAYAQH